LSIIQIALGIEASYLVAESPATLKELQRPIKRVKAEKESENDIEEKIKLLIIKCFFFKILNKKQEILNFKC
jgi:hypothetical protein